MNFKSKLKNILSAALAVSTLLSGFTPITTYAAQSNDYVDPADSWLETNNRTNELDANATVTSGTQFCFVCEKDTLSISYRVPEYTKTGETALNRGVALTANHTEILTTADRERTHITQARIGRKQYARYAEH